MEKPNGLSWEHTKNEKGVDMATLNRQQLVDFMIYAEHIQQQHDKMKEDLKDYEDANNDKKRLVREIDVILCGKDAALQASLCDLISPIRELKEKHDQLLKNQKAYLEAIKANNMVLTEIYSHFGWQFDLQAQANTEHLIKTNKIILE